MLNPDILKEIEQAKMRSGDRILVLKPIQGEVSKTVFGNVDPRLFKGGNQLHLIRDPQSYMWTFKYDNGFIPEQLKQKFTKFDWALKAATDYYIKRNLQIVEIKDAA